MPEWLIVYLAAVNLTGFTVCGADKRAAVKHKRRIRERTLLLLAFAGGALGVWLSMLVFHHKTKKLKFMVLVPLALVAQAAAVYFLANNA